MHKFHKTPIKFINVATGCNVCNSVAKKLPIKILKQIYTHITTIDKYILYEKQLTTG